MLARSRLVHIQYISNIKTGILKWSAAILFLYERMHDIYVNRKHRGALVLFVRPLFDNFFDSHLLVYVMKPHCFARLINASSELLCCHSWQLRSFTPYQKCLTAQKVELLAASYGSNDGVAGND